MNSKSLPLFVLVLLQCGHVIAAQKVADSRQYCQLDSFIASCKRSQVILMERALFGRMEIGRCVKSDLGYMGCHSDVRDIADRLCSGLQRCEIKIPNDQMEKRKPCFSELKSYFEAQFRCIDVVAPSLPGCKSCRQRPLSATSGFISSHSPLPSGHASCGTENCPWHIVARSGQSVNLTLYDFTYETRSDIIHSCSVALRQYAKVKEIGQKSRIISVCPGQRRQSHVFLSKGHDLKLVMAAREPGDSKGIFLIHYQVIGCADLESNGDKWFRRTGLEAADVGCKLSDRTWSLACRDGQWRGDVGNCSEPLMKIEAAERILGTVSISYGTAVLIIVMVALGVGIIVLFIGLIAWRRRHQMGLQLHRQRATNCKSGCAHALSEAVYLESTDNAQNTAHQQYQHHQHQQQQQQQHQQQQLYHKSNCLQYTQIWEMPTGQSDGAESPTRRPCLVKQIDGGTPELALRHTATGPLYSCRADCRYSTKVAETASTPLSTFCSPAQRRDERPAHPDAEELENDQV